MPKSDERAATAKHQKGEQIGTNFIVGRSVINAAAHIAAEYFDECFENDILSWVLKLVLLSRWLDLASEDYRTNNKWPLAWYVA